MQDEFSLIRKMIPRQYVQPSLIQGIGDDAALFSGSESFEEIVCMDTMVEGVHFTEKTMRPYDVGYKALAANLSDIAAMGGDPTYCLASVAVPERWQPNLDDLYRGMADLAKSCSVDLIGGDTVAAKDSFVMTVTVLGRVENGRHLLRSNANPGDAVFVTGTLGDSAAGLALLLEHGLAYDFSTDEMKWIQAHQRPIPQIRAGRILSSLSSQIALNDISDGIASEANEIAEASNVTLVLDEGKLPVSKSLRSFPKEQRKEWILYGGEDFQLAGTVPQRHVQDMKKRFEKERLSVTFIGTVEEGPAQVKLKTDGRTVPLDKRGFNHFHR